jgi:hypothetical protein
MIGRESAALPNVLCVLIALCGCDGDKTSPPSTGTPWTTTASAEPPADPDKPETCARCHEAIVREYSESMHARAHHERDPIYAGVRKLRAKREGAEITKACANCHTPRDLVDADSSVAKMGVTCGSCHAVHEVKDGARGAAALQFNEGNLLLGPHDVAEGKTPAHATGAAPAHMKDGNHLCNACHKELHTPTGVAMCTTGMEHESIEGDETKRCVECHMPEEKGPSGSAVARTSHRSHRFLGPHRAWYQNDDSILKASVVMSAELAPGKLTVTLKNMSQHAVPTGFPGRMALLNVEGMRTGSSDVAYRSDDKPKGAVMRKKYVDENGKPTLAPWAKELKSDTRLEPNEERQVVFDLPKDIVEARVQLIFRLLPPPLAKKLKLTSAPESKPKVVLERTVKLSE